MHNLGKIHIFVKKNNYNLLSTRRILTIVRLFKFIGTLIAILGGFLSSFAQAPSANYYFENDTVQIAYGETFSNMLHFENHGNNPVEFTKLNITSGALLSLPDTITVMPGRTRTFPVKYLSSAATVQSAIQKFSAAYASPGIVLNEEATFQAVLSTESKMSIAALDPVSYLNEATNRVSIRLRCANNGYTSVQMMLKVSSYPVGLQLTTPTQQAITIKAASEQLVTIEGINLHKDKFASDYNIIVQAVDESGNNLATSSIKVISLSSNKIQNLGQSYYSGLQTNTTALNYTTTNQGYSFYNLRANGNFQAPDSTGISYNANVNFYDQEQTVDLYDSWLSYRNKDFAVQVGNVNDNLDYPIYGRGVKASAFLDKNNSIDVFGMQNSYMLLSANGQSSGANIFGTNYNYSSGLNNTSKLTLLYSKDPNSGLSTYFSNGSSSIKLSDTQHLEIRGGLSREASKFNSNFGYASGVNYNNRSQRLDIGMNNYYSTAYYSGIQRGVLSLDERFSYNLDPMATVFVRYNYNKNAPGYDQNHIFFAGYGTKTISYESGVNFAYRRINIGLKPYILKQEVNRSYLLAGTDMNLKASSYRTELALNFNAAGKQFNLLGDYGLMTRMSSGGNKTLGGLKVNASMSSTFYSMSALVQTAPYYLTDQVTTGSADRNFRLYAIGTGVHVDGFKDKMDLSANYYISYLGHSNVGLNNSLTGNISFRIKKTWNITGQVSYNSSTNFPGNYNMQSQLGIVKHFSKSTSPGNAKLAVEFYGDDNANGVWDSNEEAVEGVISNLSAEGSVGSSLATISSKSGKVTYVNLKKTAYSLHVSQSGDRHLSSPLNLLLTKNEKMQVPLVRSGWLKGHIHALKQEYIASNTILEGVRIVAKDANNQTFETFTDEEGGFQIPLPLNEYTIIVDLNLEKYAAVNTKKVVQILRNNNPDVQFEIMDISRKVVVKEF